MKKLKKYLGFISLNEEMTEEEWNGLPQDVKVKILKDRDIISKTKEEESELKSKMNERERIFTGAKSAISSEDVEKFMEVVGSPENARDYDNGLALRFACRGSLEFIKGLESKGISFDHPRFMFLLNAADNGNLDVVKHLIEESKVKSDPAKIAEWIRHSKKINASQRNAILNYLESIK